MSFWGKIGNFAAGMSQGLPVGAQIGQSIVGSYNAAREGALNEQQQVKQNEFRSAELDLQRQNLEVNKAGQIAQADQAKANRRDQMATAAVNARTQEEAETIAAQAESAGFTDVAASARARATSLPTTADARKIQEMTVISSMGPDAAAGLAQYAGDASSQVSGFAGALQTGMSAAAKAQKEREARQEAQRAVQVREASNREIQSALFSDALKRGNYATAADIAKKNNFGVPDSQLASWNNKGDRPQGYTPLEPDDLVMANEVRLNAGRIADERVKAEAPDQSKAPALRSQYLQEELQNNNQYMPVGTRFIDQDPAVNGKMNGIIKTARRLYEGNKADAAGISKLIDTQGIGLSDAQKGKIKEELSEIGILDLASVSQPTAPAPTPTPSPMQPNTTQQMPSQYQPTGSQGTGLSPSTIGALSSGEDFNLSSLNIFGNTRRNSREALAKIYGRPGFDAVKGR